MMYAEGNKADLSKLSNIADHLIDSLSVHLTHDQAAEMCKDKLKIPTKVIDAVFLDLYVKVEAINERWL